VATSTDISRAKCPIKPLNKGRTLSELSLLDLGSKMTNQKPAFSAGKNLIFFIDESTIAENADRCSALSKNIYEF